MATDDKVIAQTTTRLTEVLDRLAGITAEGSLARKDLVERLESLLRAFESVSGETLEGLVQALSRHLGTLQPSADVAVVFGSAAQGELLPGSDVDVLLIARNLSQLEAQAHFKPAGRELKRPVNVIVYTPAAWLAALQSEGSLAQGIVGRPTLVLKGVLPTSGASSPKEADDA
ncbi:nucleotidyltransferase domain-containing protein [Mitsuaria sp. TWR114]|uniref:nucleotidyltransferase domain-containing protein n=1 Tax=Mitsuaria sp. TWR114 TaxID=2601731 RepID=UPI00164ABC71|nr:nucleotidyltransferase domain-containing protein [Mitsuaria sp. TWR114]